MNLETKKQINNIRSKYDSTDNIIFKTAILHLFHYGVEKVSWEDENAIVFEHPELFYLKGVYSCAVDLSNISIHDILEYIQTSDLFYELGALTYPRLFRIAESLLSRIDTDNADRAATYETLSGILTDREIKILGGEYILDAVKEHDHERLI